MANTMPIPANVHITAYTVLLTLCNSIMVMLLSRGGFPELPETQQCSAHASLSCEYSSGHLLPKHLL